MSTTLVKPSLTIKRRLNAAPTKVYSAWTEPEKVKRWFGPAQMSVVDAAFDCRAGGKWHIHGKSTDGEENYVSGVVREVVPDQRLVYTWAWRSTPERESLVTVEFKPDGAGTLLTITHEHFYDESARDRHQYGWSGALDKLEAFFA